MSEEVTFRDFAGALMGNDWDRAAEVLTVLLGVDGERAKTCAAHFQEQMKSGPDFMMKAMGMRTLVTSGDRDGLVSLLGDCFGLEGEPAGQAADKLLARYSG